MTEWMDPLTGRRYRFTSEGLRKVRQHVAGRLAAELAQASTMHEKADAAARFWAERYYRLVFPFGFTKVIEGEQVRGEALPSGPVVELDGMAEFRDKPLQGQPPVLPAGEGGASEALLADVMLVRTALINVLLRQKGMDRARLDTVRLACLTAPLVDELSASGLQLPEEVNQIIAFLSKKEQALRGLDTPLVRAVWEAVGSADAAKSLPDELSVVLVIGAVQRVKQYVFDTPGLNEIRGGSELLEQITEQLGKKVAEELGPEVLVRAAGSQVEFLAPQKQAADGVEWALRIRRAYLEATGGVLVAAVARSLKVKDLLVDYQRQMGLVYQELEVARSKVDIPLTETLPFEERCSICRRRSAEGWFTNPEGVEEPVCRICLTKRERGRAARRGKTTELAEWLKGAGDPWGLGGDVRAPQSLNELCPEGVRRRWVAVIYGDGNNFGAIVQRQQSIVEALQWTRRVKTVTESAAALALAEAVRVHRAPEGDGGASPPMDYLPFQVLALGGEDLSLFAWAPIGLRFAQRFVELTDAEFEPADGSAEGPRVCFSLGVLITDEKAPVRRTVDFTEEQLLKWAKRMARQENYRQGGAIAFLVAPSADQIPGDVEEYKRRMYLRQGKMYSICLTLRPVTAAELRFLIQKAAQLRQRGYAGQVERMAEAFIKGQPRVAVLYYLYQKIRERSQNGHLRFTGLLEDTAGLPSTLTGLQYPAALLAGRRPFGEDTPTQEQAVWFSPLGDLAELVKILA